MGALLGAVLEKRLKPVAFAEMVPASKMPVQELLELVGDEADNEEEAD